MSDELDRVLLECGLSYSEYAVLFHVADTVVVPRKSLVEFTVQHPPANRALDLDESERAVESCLARGLLIELDAVDIAADLERWKNETRPYSFSVTTERQIADIDLTEAGFRIYSAVNAKLYPDYSAPPASSFNDATPGRIDVFGATEAVCTLRQQIIVDSICAGKWLKSPKFVRNEPPAAIGAWWLSRFELISTGYRAVIHLGQRTRCVATEL